MEHDELMDELPHPENTSTYEAFFQFGEEGESVKFATVQGGHTFSITLDGSATESPEVSFFDGKGNVFKLFLSKCS